MRVEVEGLVTSVKVQEREGKKFTTIMLAQDDEREQVLVRIDDDRSGVYAPMTIEKFRGRLVCWRSRDGVGKMVLVGV